MNKQLDLQSMLTAAGRCLSQLQGWYDERRVFQRDFIIGLLITAGLFLALVLWLMRRYSKVVLLSELDRDSLRHQARQLLGIPVRQTDATVAVCFVDQIRLSSAMYSIRRLRKIDPH